VVHQQPTPVGDSRAEEQEILLEGAPASVGEPSPHGRGVDRADVARLVGGQIADALDSAECAELAAGRVRGLVEPRVAKLGEVLGADEVVESVPVVDLLTRKDVEEAEVYEADGGEGDERDDGQAQPA